MKLDIKYLNTVCNDPWLKWKKGRDKILENAPDKFNKKYSKINYKISVDF